MLIYVGELLLSNQNRIVYSGDTLHATLTCPPHSRYGAGIQVPSLWKLHPGSSSATKRLVSPANLKGRSKLPFDPPKLGGFHRFTNTNHVPNVVKRNALAMQSASRHVLRGKTVDANGSGSLRSQRKSWTGWINAQKQHQNHTAIFSFDPSTSLSCMVLR